MRKIILLLLSAVCLVCATHAQRYQVTTGTSSPENQWAVVEDPAIAGYVEIGNVTVGGISQVWISSYAPNGAALTSARATNGRNMIARDISLAPNDANGNRTYYVTGWTQIQGGGAMINQMFVGRIDLGGFFLWYQETPFPNGNHSEGVAIVTEPATADAVAVGIVQWPAVGGVPAGPRVLMVRFGPLGGAPIWSNVYNLAGNWMPREIDLGVPAPGCVVAAPPGNFIITGEAVVPPVAVPQTFAAVYNGAGAECWRNLYPAAAAAFPTPFGDAGYDVVFHPVTGNYCIAGVAQTAAARAAPTSTPYFLNVTPAGALAGSAVYTTPVAPLQPLGLYPRCISLGQVAGQVTFAGPDFAAGRVFWGMLPGIAPFGAGPLNNYAGLATANSVGQPMVLNDAWPEDVLFTNLGTIPGYLVSTNAVPGAFGAGDGHFIRTNVAGQTPDSCKETRKPIRPNNSLRSQNQVSVRFNVNWANVPTGKNPHPVQQNFCRDTCFVNASYTYIQTGTSVSFTSTSTASGPMVYSWDFGDGSPLDPNPNPTHNYTGTASYYIACLTVTTTNASGITCSDKFCDTIFLCSANADFNYSVACKTAAFTNTSTGTGTLTYSWDFGDGGTSTATNPTHTYTACGNYTVRLITCDAICCDTIYKNVNIPCCAVKSDFCLTTHGRDVTLNVTSSNPAGTTYDTYLDGVLTPSWTTGTTQTLSAGTHTVCVKATYINACGDTCCATSCKTISVSDLCTLAADFWFQVQSNGTVAFSDQSTGGVSNSYLWDFGDGNTSTTASPTHTYTSTGSFTVCLTVTSVNGADTCRQYTCKTVVIDKPCVVFADYTATHCTATPFTVVFKNLSINASSYEWDFGDGSGIDLSTDPTHTYAAQGTYIVCLKAIVSSNCWYTACYQVIVSTTTYNNDCNNLPANPLYRLFTPVKNEMKLLAVNASPGIIQKEEANDKALQPGKVEMFPNPASQQVNAVFVSPRAEKSEVMVLNAAGKLVYKTTSALNSGKNQLAIPVNNLPGGIYLVRIQTGAQTLSGNFFINNR